jgi:hypothetical protein
VRKQIYGKSRRKALEINLKTSFRLKAGSNIKRIWGMYYHGYGFWHVKPEDFVGP